MMTLTPDVSGAKDYLARLQRKDIPRVIGRSLTRTGNAGRSFTSRQFRARINLKKVVIDAGIKVKRSNEIQTLAALNLGRAYFEIRWSGKPLPIRDFAARRTGKGATYQISRAQARKVFRRKGRPGFIVDKLGGHVFVRVTENPPGPMRAKIKKAIGPSIPQFASTKRERQALIAFCTDFWNREVIRNAKFALERASK